jgi:hypothetical protein
VTGGGYNLCIKRLLDELDVAARSRAGTVEATRSMRWGRVKAQCHLSVMSTDATNGSDENGDTRSPW